MDWISQVKTVSFYFRIEVDHIPDRDAVFLKKKKKRGGWESSFREGEFISLQVTLMMMIVVAATANIY